MNKPTCYRAVIMRVTEIEVEFWADTYEEAVRRAHTDDDERLEVENVMHTDRVIDIFPHDQEYQC